MLTAEEVKRWEREGHWLGFRQGLVIGLLIGCIESVLVYWIAK